MKSMPNFATLLQRFFIERLTQQRHASPHTISSYRDTFRLLLKFAGKRLRKSPEGQYLCGNDLSLADIHLAPMIGYFVLASEGRALFEKHLRLRNWWLGLSQRTAYLATIPRIPQPAQ